MNNTGIEYLDFTWNPIAMRCTQISEGCKYCWHLRTAERLRQNDKLPERVRLAHAGEIDPQLIKKRLYAPFRKKKPSRVGVQFMGDLFHSKVPFGYVDQIMGSIVKFHWHEYLILTKRVGRALEYQKYRSKKGDIGFPRNVWFGITAEDQDNYYSRIADFNRIAAGRKFISIEPMLSEMVLDFEKCPVDLVIVGGESGKNARPIPPNGPTMIRDQCQEAKIPFFFKQWGEWIYRDFGDEEVKPERVGVDKAGNMLDGRQHVDFPRMK